MSVGEYRGRLGSISLETALGLSVGPLQDEFVDSTTIQGAYHGSSSSSGESSGISEVGVGVVVLWGAMADAG